MLDLIAELATSYTLRNVALGAATLGLVGGGLGTFAVLRGQSLLGDAISHAALPGIALAFLITGSKSPLALMAGAAVVGVAATLLLIGVTENTRVKYDSALGIVLSVFFGVGLVLLTYIQRHAGASQAGLDAFLFGQAAALVRQDVITMAALGGGALLILLLFWKEVKLLAFDDDFGRSLGLPMRAVDVLLTTLLVVAIVIGLQTVGVVLMSAVIVAPAAAARQWTDRLGRMVVLAGVFGAASGVGGAVASSVVPNLPTGPTIVLVMGAVAAVSLLAAPNRGLLWRWWTERKRARRLRRDAALLELHGRPEAEARERVSSKTLSRLQGEGLVTRADGEGWALTDEGRRTARSIEQDRTFSAGPSRGPDR